MLDCRIPILLFAEQPLVYSRHTNGTELTWNKSTQLHDAFIGHARQRHHLVGCSETRSASAQRVLDTRVPLRLPTLQFQSVNQSINVKFVGRRYTTRPGAPTVVSAKHDHEVHS